MPATTRARAKAPETLVDPALVDDQMTMSQFGPFAALAHRQTSAVEQLAAKKGRWATRGTSSRLSSEIIDDNG